MAGRTGRPVEVKDGEKLNLFVPRNTKRKLSILAKLAGISQSKWLTKKVNEEADKEQIDIG